MNAPLAAPVRAEWSTAVPDWADRIRAGASLLPDLPLDARRADRALAIFRALRVPDIEGHPTYGEVCAPFVFKLVRAIFGAFDRETGERMIREFFVLIPKKNGKTSIAAAILVAASILNQRPDAEMLMIAPTISIAERSFKQAKGIVRLTVMPSGAALADLFSVHDHIRTIRNLNPDVPSELTIKAADADVITGSKASVVLIDETHEFASKPRAAGVFLEVRGGLSHPQNRGFLLQITTQSKRPPQGVFRAELRRARDVRDGKLAMPMLPLLYELPADMAAEDGWQDPATWPLVNPHLGRSVSEAFLSDQLRAAEDEGRAALALVASQHFNVEIGTALHDDRWEGAELWADHAEAGLTLESLVERCEAVCIGIDWGSNDDLAALCVIGREAGTGRWLVWVTAWARPRVFDLRPQIAPALRDFEGEGDLVVLGTGREIAESIADICEAVQAAGKLPEKGGIGVDYGGLGGSMVMDALEARDLGEPIACRVQQGWHLNRPAATLALRLADGDVRHAGQPLLAWAVGNVRVELKGSNLYYSKEVSGASKIDPFIAMVNAAELMSRHPVASRCEPRIRFA